MSAIYAFLFAYVKKSSTFAPKFGKIRYEK